MSAQIEFLRRLGPDPCTSDVNCVGCDGCPDIWELETGDFAVIGIDITDAAKLKLPATSGCGPNERVVLLPRKLLVNAKGYIPNRM